MRRMDKRRIFILQKVPQVFEKYGKIGYDIIN